MISLEQPPLPTASPPAGVILAERAYTPQNLKNLEKPFHEAENDDKSLAHIVRAKTF